MGGAASKAKKAEKAEKERAAAERHAEMMKRVNAKVNGGVDPEKQRKRSIDEMGRKGSLTADARLELIAAEEKIVEAEKKLKNKAVHFLWKAGGSPGSAGYHYAGDEHTGNRRKAGADEDTDDSDDDQAAVEDAQKAMRYAKKYAELVKENRAKMESAFPCMVGSMTYAGDVAEAEAFVDETVQKLEQLKASMLKEED